VREEQQLGDQRDHAQRPASRARASAAHKRSSMGTRSMGLAWTHRMLKSYCSSI
jgi:hypothetical protein